MNRQLRSIRIAIITAVSLTVVDGVATQRIQLVLPAPTYFGMVYVGHCVTQSLTIRNAGDETTAVAPTVTYNGGASPTFRCLNQVVLAPKENGFLQVEYCPLGLDSDKASLVIPYCDVGALTLRGVGVRVALTVTPDSCVDLGAISTSAFDTLHLVNNGNIADPISYTIEPADSAVEIRFVGGTYVPDVDAAKSPPLPLAQPQTAIAQVIRTKTGSSHSDSARIVFLNKLGDRLDSACLHWRATGSISDYVVRFPGLSVGLCDTEVVVVHSAGAPVVIDSMATVGSAAHAFTWIARRPVALSFPHTLAAGDSLVVAWAFCPGPADTADMSDAYLAVWYDGVLDRISQATGARGLASTGIHGVAGAAGALQLFQTIPNPAIDLVTIPFASTGGRIAFVVTNAIGAAMHSMELQNVAPGRSALSFDTRLLPAGEYWYSIIAGSRRVTRAMAVVR